MQEVFEIVSSTYNVANHHNNVNNVLNYHNKDGVLDIVNTILSCFYLTNADLTQPPSHNTRSFGNVHLLTQFVANESVPRMKHSKVGFIKVDATSPIT